MERLNKQLEFLIEIDKMKDILRQSVLCNGTRRENDAEHSWHFALMASILYEYCDDERVDINRVIRMALIHDLVEVYAGDTFAYDIEGNKDKRKREEAAGMRLFSLLPKDQGQDLYLLWKEFDDMESPDAIFASAIDRFQPIILNYQAEGYTWKMNKTKSSQVYERIEVVKKASTKLWSYLDMLIKESIDKGYLLDDNFALPPSFNCEDILKDFASAALLASFHINEIYKRDFTVSYKEDSSPVTEADLLSNTIITSHLKGKYPDYAILAEESYDKEDIEERIKKPFCFIIDPIDGTKEFVSKSGEFAINLALAYKGYPVVGMIFVPIDQTIYYAALGHGAYKTSGPKFLTDLFNQDTRIKVSRRTKDLICLHSKSNFDKETEEILENNKDKISQIISRGSAIKMGEIAEGKADIYYRKGLTMEWDTAAGQIIIEEAGGMMRQLDENESKIYYNRADSRNLNGFFILNRIENKLLP